MRFGNKEEEEEYARRSSSRRQDVRGGEEEEAFVAVVAGLEGGVVSHEGAEGKVASRREAEVSKFVAEGAALEIEDAVVEVTARGAASQSQGGSDGGQEVGQGGNGASQDKVERPGRDVFRDASAKRDNVRRRRGSRALLDDPYLLAATVGERELDVGTRNRQRQPREAAARAGVQDAHAPTLPSLAKRRETQQGERRQVVSPASQSLDARTSLTPRGPSRSAPCATPR
mmetsp:Transcript_6203/g.18781  ORF Transcript_6203/g.18781 Transcript_6203/m.18781 type:complete len:229 (-) Transcript_6203:234-920(-)